MARVVRSRREQAVLETLATISSGDNVGDGARFAGVVEAPAELAIGNAQGASPPS